MYTHARERDHCHVLCPPESMVSMEHDVSNQVIRRVIAWFFNIRGSMRERPKNDDDDE